MPSNKMSDRKLSHVQEAPAVAQPRHCCFKIHWQKHCYSLQSALVVLFLTADGKQDTEDTLKKRNYILIFA